MLQVLTLLALDVGIVTFGGHQEGHLVCKQYSLSSLPKLFSDL